MTLPPVFDSHQEPVKFMARIKDRASKNFRWTSKRPLEDAMYLANWSYVFGRNHDALQVCEFMAQFQFSGDHNLWTWIESTLALQARLLRSQDRKQEAANCVARIWEAGFVKTRLDGLLLDSRNLDAAIFDWDKIRERDRRAILLKELCILIELGGSDKLPVQSLEAMFQENLVRLQELVGGPH